MWCDPTFSYISYDSAAWVRNIMCWLNNVSRGKDDRRRIFNQGGVHGWRGGGAGAEGAVPEGR